VTLIPVLSVELEEVKLVEPAFELERVKARYKAPLALKWIGPAVDYEDALAIVQREVPLGVDVVEWMREAAAVNAIIDTSIQSYSDNGGRLLGGSGDGYIPGVSVQDTYFPSVSNYTLTSEGRAALVTPVGTYYVPANGKTLVAKGSYLGWAAARRGTDCQWLAAILRWLSLATASRGSPVTNISFTSVSGLVAPQFVAVNPPIGLRHVNHLTLSTNAAQTVTIDYRSPSDYGSVYSSTNVRLAPGSNSLRLRVLGFGSYVLGVHPSNGTTTTLDKLEVRRI